MPTEFMLLQGKPVKLSRCPACGDTPFDPMMRGMILRPKKFLWFFGPYRDYCALICSKCKRTVGYESP
jgi:hypothetical protein